jgi:hypothetical protein
LEFEVSRFGIDLHVCCSPTTGNRDNMLALMEEPAAPVASIPLTAHTFGGPDTLWTAQITLPAARGSRPFRLVIEEFEIFTQDVAGSQQLRLVYADVLNL